MVKTGKPVFWAVWKMSYWHNSILLLRFSILHVVYRDTVVDLFYQMLSEKTGGDLGELCLNVVLVEEVLHVLAC